MIEEEQRIKPRVESSLLKLLKKEVIEIVGIAADSNDVAIACDDDLFRAHRVILSTFSSFLENILLTIWFQICYKTRYCLESWGRHQLHFN